MEHPPTLKTRRLILRPFSISDAFGLKELAGHRKVYETTLNIPHPYEDGMAEKWISTHPQIFYIDGGVNLAITLKDDTLIGATGLMADKRHKRAELGYWVGVPYWGEGYCTEAVEAIIAYGFSVLGFHKIIARHMKSNPASGRVMQKAGMNKEGELVDEILKDDKYHTLIVYGIIAQSDAKA
jgi:RimJ/RimL family protein N-acetyltransferase